MHAISHNKKGLVMLLVAEMYQYVVVMMHLCTLSPTTCNIAGNTNFHLIVIDASHITCILV